MITLKNVVLRRSAKVLLDGATVTLGKHVAAPSDTIRLHP